MRKNYCISLATAAFVLLTCSAWPTLAAGPRAKANSGKTYEFKSARATGDVDRVVAILEVGGNLKHVKDEKIVRPKTSLVANFAYDEKTLHLPNKDDNHLRSVRHYDQAKAVAKVDLKVVKPTLPDGRQLIGVDVDATEANLFSPKGPLTREQLDLIDIPGNSMLVDRLLPNKPVAQGDRWTHPDDLIAALLKLDSVAENKLTSTLDKVDGKSALMSMTGRVEGAVGGVTSRMEIQAKYQFNRKTGRIDWLGLLIKEDRDIGHVDQGMDITARLRMQIKPADQPSKHLTDRALAGLPLKPAASLTQLAFAPEDGGWRLLHDRRWFALEDNARIGVLRMIDRGELVAQCNFVTLRRVEPGNQMTLERFQEGIREALGKRFGEFVSASQQANDQNYRILRVVVRGLASDLPIQWHYYLIADRYGRQVSFTFWVEGNLLKRLGSSDQQLIHSFRFDPASVAGKDGNRR
ncbi:MAG: hypothetical protein JW818_00920 [Pirellulales bacterium]|nr:hypothetical protein [Pirellulales bacterium]